MSDNLRKAIYLNFSQRDTDDLLEIWRTSDRYEWSEMTFDVIREILQERHIEPPPQSKPVYAADRLTTAVNRDDQQERPIELSSKAVPADGVGKSEAANHGRPTTVTGAVYMAVGGLAVGLVLFVINLATGQFKTLTTYPQFSVFVALGAVGFMALEAFLIYGIWLARNGFRIAWIGLALFSILSTLTNSGWTESFATQPLRTGLSFLPMCLDLVAVLLLVLPISSAWFREMKPAKVSEAQTTQKRKLRPQTRRVPRWLSELSPDRWVKHYTFGALAASFAVGLLASWLVYNLVLWLQEPDHPFDLFPNLMYAMSCLPVQAIAMLVGAVIGARSAPIAEARWRRATYGVWVVGIVALLLALVGASVLPRSGS